MSSYAIKLAQELVRCRSVTPYEAGALDLLESELTKIGFVCTRLPFGSGDQRVDNLFARWRAGKPNFAFAGHVDVVPSGDEEAWAHKPFGGVVNSGKLFGRGAADMKGAIAAFLAAANDFVNVSSSPGSISLIITGDEEGVAEFGTVKMIEWMIANNQIPDFCIVGEPTNPERLGDMIKTGRRGSLSCQLCVRGKQGHVAYPHLADNPINHLFNMLAPVNGKELDNGNVYFDPSTANVTTIDTGNPSGNIIPNSVTAKFNIRFNTEHNGGKLIDWLEKHFNTVGCDWTANWNLSAIPFITPTNHYIDGLRDSINVVTGKTPALSTSGGTSDARFITKICPVAEFGLVGKTMHKIDENVDVDDIDALVKIYENACAVFKVEQ